MMKYILLPAAFMAMSFAFNACGPKAASDADIIIEEEVATSPKVDAVTGYIDPACKMKVAEDAPITHTHEGVTYGFCGEGCKTAFAADPAAFLAALEE